MRPGRIEFNRSRGWSLTRRDARLQARLRNRGAIPLNDRDRTALGVEPLGVEWDVEVAENGGGEVARA